jgi:hypothetical protein
MIEPPILSFVMNKCSLINRHVTGLVVMNFINDYPLNLHTLELLLQSLTTYITMTMTVQIWFRQVLSASTHAFSVPAEGNVSEIVGPYLSLPSFKDRRDS